MKKTLIALAATAPLAFISSVDVKCIPDLSHLAVQE
jgi:hypothetical protein